VASQPTLGKVTYQGKTVDAVLQATKQGLLFTLNRETGQPIIPVEERKVPQRGAPGEKLSVTQPFPVAPVPLAPTHISADDAFGLTFWDRGKCREMIKGARNEGIYTPPSTQGTILYPFTGGGTNHRIGLFDAILVKENHIIAAGSIAAAVAQARATAEERMVEIEVENLDELRQALETDIDRVLLDNFSLQDLVAAVKTKIERKGYHVQLEASGNVSLGTIRDVARTGVDFISVGGLTKHVQATDLSMRFVFGEQ